MNICYRFLILFTFSISCNSRNTEKQNDSPLPDFNIGTDSLEKLLIEDTFKGKGKLPKSQKTNIVYLEGLLALKKGNYEIARKAFSNAIQLSDKGKNKKLLANARRDLGNTLKNQGEYDKALVEFKKALLLYETLKDKKSSAITHGYIAQIFQLQNDLKQSEKHLLDGFKVLGSDTNNTSFLILMHTLANVYGMSAKYKEALNLDERGIKISTLLKAPEFKATFLDNKANCFLYDNQLDSAEYYFKQCLLTDTINKKQLSDTWLNLGILAEKQGKLTKATENFQQSIRLSEEATYRKGQMQAWEALSKLYKKDQNFSAALEAQTRYSTIKDSIQNITKEKAIQEWKVVYETDSKDKVLQLNQLTIQKKNIIILAVAIVSLLLILNFWFQNKRSKLLHQKDFEKALLDKEQQAIISILSAEEKERKRIAEDLHDGIGQSLTAVWLQLQALNKSSETSRTLDADESIMIDRATNQLESCCSEVRLLSHNLMPDIILERGLESALHKLITTIDKRTLAINLDYTLSNEEMSKTSQILIYRIIQECLNNVLKHANATELELCITEEDNHIAILIEDNGIGFETSNSKKASGIGIQNITSRVQFLNGTVEWNSIPGQGTAIALFIPLTNGKK